MKNLQKTFRGNIANIPIAQIQETRYADRIGDSHLGDEIPNSDLCPLLTLAACMTAFAQTNTGSIVGIVRDSSGAVVPDTVINVTNEATNVSMSFKTNADGEYQALQLIPGNYNVKATHTGYQAEVQSHIAVDVQTRAQVDFFPPRRIGTAERFRSMRRPRSSKLSRRLSAEF